MTKRKPNLVFSNLPSLEDIDTSVISIEKLQDFCVRIGTEMEKTKKECQALELEVNKLKAWTNIESMLNNASTMSTILANYQLEWQNINATKIGMDIGRNRRNVFRENAQQVVHKVSSCAQKLKKLSHDFYEVKLEIELDIDLLKRRDQENCTSSNANYIKSLITLSESKSRVRDTFVLNNNIFISSSTKMSEETLRCITEKQLQLLNNFEKYKNTQIQEYLKENEKQSTKLRHYYEKLVRHNTKILNKFHEQYKSVRADNTYINRQVKRETLAYQQKCHQLEQLIDSSKGSMALLQNKQEKRVEQGEIRKKHVKSLNRFDNLRWDFLLIEEALALKEKNVREHLTRNTEYLHKIKLNILESSIILENLASKIARHLKLVNLIVEFARTKGSFLGKKITSTQIKQLALNGLEKEVKKSMDQKVKECIAKTSAISLAINR